MRRFAVIALAIAACARPPKPESRLAIGSSEVSLVPFTSTECYSLTYSDPKGSATERLFPSWIALLPGQEKGPAEGHRLPDFMTSPRYAKDNYMGWRRAGDSVQVMFTSTAEGISIHLARADSGIAGRAIWLTDLVGRPEASMRVHGVQENCPPQIQSTN